VGLLAGGHAALWTGIVGPRYAPDLEILGVAAIAPAANIKNILAMNVAMDKRFGPYLALRTAGSTLTSHSSKRFGRGARCCASDSKLMRLRPARGSGTHRGAGGTFDGPALATSSNKALQARLEQNAANGLIKAPVVIAQGLSDTVVPPSATDAYVEERCSAGQRLEYWTFAGRDHFTIVQPGDAARGVAHQVDDGALRE
jgi:Secretory lipase.